jgi:hypothetical protein
MVGIITMIIAALRYCQEPNIALIAFHLDIGVEIPLFNQLHLFD